MVKSAGSNTLWVYFLAALFGGLLLFAAASTAENVSGADQPDRPFVGRAAKRHALLAARRQNRSSGIQEEVAAAVSPDAGSGNQQQLSSGPDLRLLAVVVADSGVGGNADSWIQPGETVMLQISLMNFGNSAAHSVYGQLDPAEDNPYVTINTKSALWPDIPAHGSTSTLTPHFSVTVSNVLPCGQRIELSLSVQAIGYSATIPIHLDLARPYSLDTVADTARRYNESDSITYGAYTGETLGAVAFGDINGDGYQDLIMASPQADYGRTNAGAVYVLYGSSSGLPNWVDLLAPPAGSVLIYGADASDMIGVTLAAADVDGDGYDDILIGAPYGDGYLNGDADGGEVWVVYGRASALPATVDLAAPSVAVTQMVGQSAGDHFGSSLAVGDLDGDGFDDILIGVPDSAGSVAGPRTESGEAFAIYGRGLRWGNVFLTPMAVGLVASVAYGADSEDRLGSAVAAGDFNGDGYDDVLLGAYWSSGLDFLKANIGEAWILYGQSDHLQAVNDLQTAPPNSSVIFGADPSDTLGAAVAAADVNGDGYDEAIIGASGSGGPGNARASSGEVWILYGQAGQFPSSIDLFAPPDYARVIFGRDTGDMITRGNSIATGDMNGDGYDDFVLGAANAAGPSNGKPFAGEAWLILGRPAQMSSMDLFNPPVNARVIYGPDSYDYFSLSSLAAGDMNGDGFDDLLIGAPMGDGLGNARAGSGEAHLILGSAGRTYWEKTETYSWIDASSGANLGLSCDDCSTSLPIGFPFSYFGNKYDWLYVSSNGLVSFQPIQDAISGTPRCMNSKSPSSLASPGPIVAPFWDDLDLRSAGAVFSQMTGTAPNRRLTIEWLNVPHYPTTAGTATFELSLFESSGQILFQYQDLVFGTGADNGASAVVGVQNVTGAEGVGYSCNQAALTGSTSVSMNPTTPIFQDNMESMDINAGIPGKWTVSGEWHSTTTSCSPYFHGRTRSLYEGVDASCSYTNNISLDVANLPQISSFPADARLSLWQRFLSETGYDHGKIQKQANGGGYSDIADQTGYLGGGNWYYSTPYFLNANAGQTVDLRFAFNSDVSNVQLGWMIDDVKITGCNAKGISTLVNAVVYAQAVTYCGNGLNVGTLDAVGSSCGDGSNPIGYQWLENGTAIPGATLAAYTIPAGHAAGSYQFSCAVTCPGGSAASQPQWITIVAPVQAVGNTLKLAKRSGGLNIAFSWGDVAGASNYSLFQDAVASGLFGAQTGSAPTGNPGVSIAMPSENLVFYKVAGANSVCGLGPK